MHCMNRNEAKEMIGNYEGTLLSILFDMEKGMPLHKERMDKEAALEAVESAKAIVLNRDDEFSVMSLYSEPQEETEIKPVGTKLDLVIVK